MKEIRKAIHSLSDEHRNAMIARFRIKNRSEAAIVAMLTSYTGLHEVFSSMDAVELSVLEAVYQAKDGMTLGELEKLLKLKISDIAGVTENLSRLCLVYIMKNRQLINNKLDKIYRIAEISELLRIETAEAVKSHLKGLPHHLGKNGHTDRDASLAEDERRIMTVLAHNGFIASLSLVKEESGSKALEQTLEHLIKKNYVRIFHLFGSPFQTMIAVEAASAPTAMGLQKQAHGEYKTAVSNRLFFLNNLLLTYDTVTTYGLFLTKQLEFRKIDIKRISDSLITLKNIGGNAFHRDSMASFILFILNKLGCLKLLKDTAHLSLAEMQKELDNPARFIARIIKILKDPKPANPFFPSPLAIPAHEIMTTILTLLEKEEKIQFDRCALMSYLISESEGTAFQRHREQVKQAAELLCLMGVVDVRNGSLFLSDIGREIFTEKARIADVGEGEKAIYINPDFTMVIPLEEIESKSLYHLLAYVQILKHDVIMHVQVSKESIVKAKKRGMQLKRFLEILAALAKNEIPQNMKFLLNEWSRQTVELSVSSVILLKTSHPTFIDELVVGKMKHCVIDRISDTCAIIQKDCIDDIVKTGRKKDAVITLFAEEEGDR